MAHPVSPWWRRRRPADHDGQVRHHRGAAGRGRAGTRIQGLAPGVPSSAGTLPPPPPDPKEERTKKVRKIIDSVNRRGDLTAGDKDAFKSSALTLAQSDEATAIRAADAIGKGDAVTAAKDLASEAENEFLLALLYIQDDSLKTIPTGLLAFSSRYVTDYGMLFAALSIITIPMVVIYIVFNRQVTEGITAGSLK